MYNLLNILFHKLIVPLLSFMDARKISAFITKIKKKNCKDYFGSHLCENAKTKISSIKPRSRHQPPDRHTSDFVTQVLCCMCYVNER